MDLRNKTMLASGFHAPVRGEIDVLEDALIDVAGDGTIGAVHRPGDPNYRVIREAREMTGEMVRLPAGSYLLPGFVDLHVHAPQYPQLGSALDVPLATLQHWVDRRDERAGPLLRELTGFLRRSTELLGRNTAPLAAQAPWSS